MALQDEEVDKARKKSLKELMTNMKKMSEGLTNGKMITCIRNAAVHSICADDPCIVPDVLPASCFKITAEIQEAIPAKDAPTSLGSAALAPAPVEKLEGSELSAFLKAHDLEKYAVMDGIEWRAHKLKYALEKNNKLINPSLAPTKQKMLKEMLLHTAGCLATRIEDLHQPCKVEPVDIPTSSPPIR